MPTTIGAKFVLEGEKEYKQAISEINENLKVLNSEMKLSASEFENQADSMEAITAQNKILTDQIEEQKNKIAMLRGAMEQSAELNGENAKQTKEWEISLNKAQAELNKMEGQLEKNNEALQKNKENVKGLGDALDDLRVNLRDRLKKILNGMGEVNKNTVALVAGFAAAATAVAKVEKKLIDLTKEAAAAADEILTLSSQTGLATDTIQEMQYASELLDVSFETIQGSLTKLTNNMQDTAAGTGNALAAFAQLGISVTDANGNLRNAEEVFYEIVDALGEVSNETERDALSMDIFGKKAQDLNPLIEQGAERLSELADEAHEVGYVMNEEMLASLGGVDDAMQRMDNTFKTVKQNLAAQFAPYLEDFFTMASDVVLALGDVAEDSGLVDFFGAILDLVTALLPAIKILMPVFELLAVVLKPVSAVLSEIANALKTILNFAGDLARTAGNWLGEQLSGGGREFTEAVIPGNEIGSDNWRGGLTWVGENGPELVHLPQGSRIDTAQQSGMTGAVFNIVIDAKNVKEFNDIVRIAQNARFEARMGVT